MLCKTEWSCELRTCSQKMNLLDILSTFLPTTSVGNEWGQQMRIQMLILGFKGLILDIPTHCVDWDFNLNAWIYPKTKTWKMKNKVSNVFY